MKSRLQRIEIRNFKAFRNFTLDLNGRHLLVYGHNGSGKSSLYWALHTFLQSGKKPAIDKYFDPDHDQKLLNIHEEDPAAYPGEIAITFRDQATKSDTTHRISQTTHGTKQVPLITKGELASDFVTYRFFFGFSHFRNSQTFDLWPLFEKEILPFCRSTSGSNAEDAWRSIKSGNPNPWGERGTAGTSNYDNFGRKVKAFADLLDPIVDTISTRAQSFYDEHFAEASPKLELDLKVTQPAAFTGTNQQTAEFKLPQITLGIKLNGKLIDRPQSFLNEAKLTQLALSVRFAASLVNLRESDLKLLVLDDLLVSLDMSNRMKVAEILLSETFAPYQKIILTHDLGLFEELKRHIGVQHTDWQFAKLAGNAKDSPILTIAKSDLETAEDYLANDQLAECGNRLRKCAETILENFLRVAREKSSHGKLVSRGGFASLESKINEATASLSMNCYREFADVLQSNCSVYEFKTLLAEEGIDHARIDEVDKRKKGKIVAKLMAVRSDLQNSALAILSDGSRKQLTAVKVLKDVKKIKNRILNPASHAGVAPLYSKEAEDAIKIITKLQSALDDALTTL